MGGSHSKSVSEQTAILDITQIYEGTCDMSCHNIEENITVDIIDSIIGGSIIFSQSCTVDGNCIFGNTADATADVFFKATNSSNAKNAWSGWSANPFEYDSAESKSKQFIRESITQKSSQDCKLSSYNQMNDISVFVADSAIGKNIEFDQDGLTAGKCILDNNMNAAAYATGMAQNTAQSGKDKKGDKSMILKILIYGGIVIALLIITFIIAKFITGHLAKSKKSKLPTCPQGTSLVIDPKTQGYACARQRRPAPVSAPQPRARYQPRQPRAVSAPQPRAVYQRRYQPIASPSSGYISRTAPISGPE